MELELGGNFSYRSKVNLATNFTLNSQSKSLGMLNATVALKGRDDRWELRLIGRNLTDEDVLVQHAVGAMPDSYVGGDHPSAPGPCSVDV